MLQSSEPHHWFTAVAGREGFWPMELPNPRPLLRLISLRTFSRMRHRALSPHLWGRLVPNWTAGSTWLCLGVKFDRNLRPANNQNLVDRFAKRDERAALMPLWHAIRSHLAQAATSAQNLPDNLGLSRLVRVVWGSLGLKAPVRISKL